MNVRTGRVAHNHGSQARSVAEAVIVASDDDLACPACKLIRPEVMTKFAIDWIQSRGVDIFGKVPTP